MSSDPLGEIRDEVANADLRTALTRALRDLARAKHGQHHLPDFAILDTRTAFLRVSADSLGAMASAALRVRGTFSSGR